MELGTYKEKLIQRKPKQGIHSYVHEVVKDICDYFKVKEFGMWLGVAKRIGIHQLKTNFDYCKERGITNPRYLSVMCKKKVV